MQNQRFQRHILGRLKKVALYQGRVTERPSLLRVHLKWLTGRLVGCSFESVNFQKTKDELAINESGLSSDRKLLWSIWRKVGRARKPQIFKSNALDFWICAGAQLCSQIDQRSMRSLKRPVSVIASSSFVSATSGVPPIGRVAQWLGLSKSQHFWMGLDICRINLVCVESF